MSNVPMKTHAIDGVKDVPKSNAEIKEKSGTKDQKTKLSEKEENEVEIDQANKPDQGTGQYTTTLKHESKLNVKNGDGHEAKKVANKSKAKKNGQVDGEKLEDKNGNEHGTKKNAKLELNEEEKKANGTEHGSKVELKKEIKNGSVNGAKKRAKDRKGHEAEKVAKHGPKYGTKAKNKKNGQTDREKGDNDGNETQTPPQSAPKGGVKKWQRMKMERNKVFAG